MSLLRCLHRFVLIFLIFFEMVCLAGDDQSTGNTDIGSFPVFHERLELKEYQSRFQAIAATMKAAEKLASAGHPALGVTLFDIQDGSPAHKLGIRSGDIGVRLNGTNLWTQHSFFDGFQRSLEFYSKSSQKMKTVKLPEGRIGLFTFSLWRPELVYLRGTSRKPAWDAEAFVGSAVALADPDLAETAWSQAIEKGYQPDAQAAASGIEIALAQRDLPTATRFGEFLRRFENDRSELVHPVASYRLAVANGDLQEMLRIVEKYKGAIRVPASGIQELIEIRSRLLKEGSDVVDLASAVDRFVRDDQIFRLIGHWSRDLVDHLPKLRAKQSVTLSAAAGLLDAMLIAPPEPSPNLDISMKLTWLEGSDPNCDKQFSVALVDNSEPEYGMEVDERRPHLLSFASMRVSRLPEKSGIPIAMINHFRSDAPIDYETSPLKSRLGTSIHVRMIKVGHYGELYVDGCRLIRVPVKADNDQIGLIVKVLGSQLTVEDFRFDELLEDATKDAADQP